MNIEIPNPIEYPEEIIKVIENGQNISQKALDNPLLGVLHKQALQLLVINNVSFFPFANYSTIYEKYTSYVYRLFTVVNSFFFDEEGLVAMDVTKTIFNAIPPNVLLNVHHHGFIMVRYIHNDYYSTLGQLEEHMIQISAYAQGFRSIDGKTFSDYNTSIENAYGEGDDERFLKDLKCILLKFINFGYLEKAQAAQ